MKKIELALEDINVQYFAALIFALIAFWMSLLSNAMFYDGDTNWHVATGLWILDHGAVPAADPFSFTAAGHRWITHEWLSEVAMALAFKGFGWSGVRVLTGLTFALASGVFARELLRHLTPLSAVLAATLAYEVLAPHVIARPHAFALPVMLIFFAELLRARRANTTPGLWLLPLMVLWANIHASYIIGLVFLGFFGLDAVADSPSGRLRIALSWLGITAAATACCLVTPSFIEGFIFPFYLVNMKDLQAIDEWSPASFGSVTSLEAVILATIFVLVYKRVQVPPVRLALLLTLVHLTLQHVRQEIVLASVGAMLLAEPLGRALRAGPRPATVTPDPATGRRGRALALAAAAAILATAAVRLAIPEPRVDASATPVTALAHVPADIRARPVFNDYSFGGWLIFNHVKTFIDGRNDMYGDVLFRQYLDASRGDTVKLAGVFAAYRIGWAILTPSSAATRWLSHTPGWRVLYRDKWAVVFVRDPPISGR